MITSSAEKATNNSTIRGVGLLLSPKAHKALNSVETINTRTLIATFIGNPAVTVISCYSPTNVSNVDGREEFYAELSELTKAVPKHSVLLIGGDMNGKIGASYAKGSVYNKNTNENGQLLLNYVLECNLKPLNTSFKKREGKLWTHTSPSGAKCQIDYIVINNKWKNSALNCEAYNTFCSVGSDHRIVTAKTRLSLRQSKPSGKKFEYRMSSLQTFEFRISSLRIFDSEYHHCKRLDSECHQFKHMNSECHSSKRLNTECYLSKHFNTECHYSKHLNSECISWNILFPFQLLRKFDLRCHHSKHLNFEYHHFKHFNSECHFSKHLNAECYLSKHLNTKCHNSKYSNSEFLHSNNLNSECHFSLHWNTECHDITPNIWIPSIITLKIWISNVISPNIWIPNVFTPNSWIPNIIGYVIT